MNNQAAQTMPYLIVERLAAVKDHFPAGTDERKAVWEAIEYFRAAALSQTAGVADDMAAAEQLCRIYFEIAADALGEDVVRAERDRRISALAAAPAASGWNITDHSHEISFDDGLDGPDASGGESIAPIPMLLFCPKCNTQHIDAPDERTEGWNNPPHRSHLCHSCGCIWRPADVPTVGVRSIETAGKADTWSASTPGASVSERARALSDAALIAGWEAKADAYDADDDLDPLCHKSLTLRDCANELRSRADLGYSPEAIALEQALTQQPGDSLADAAREIDDHWEAPRDSDGTIAIPIDRLHKLRDALNATTPQPGAEALRELVQQWRTNGHPYVSDCADELESLLARGGK